MTSPLRIPFFCKFQNPRTDVKRKRIGERPALGDQLHRLLRTVALRDQNAGAHRHPAVTPARAVGVHLAPVTDRFEGGLGAALQRLEGNRQEWGIERAKPEKGQRRIVCVGQWRKFPAHVDDEAHAESAQVVVIICRGRGADEEIVRDVGIVHAGNLIIRNPL